MLDLDRIIQVALAEDIGLGDITTESVVDATTQTRAELVAKEDFLLAGIDVAARVFSLLDPAISFEKLLEDGQRVRRGEVLAWLKGSARPMLSGERTALNLLQRMSGIATQTAVCVEAVAGTGAAIVDTRKTAPGLRSLDKYAVRMGGGRNHRIGLFDGVLLKENHIAAAGGIAQAVAKARLRAPHTLRVEVEVRDLAEVEQALAAGADILLLDNMELGDLAAAVAIIGDRALTEASGGVTPDTVRAVAETGVQLISLGMLTHSVRAVDISLLFQGV
jgi:nicotinate-nucleotide pyrophosphorylase (carboxylating)